MIQRIILYTLLLLSALPGLPAGAASALPIAAELIPRRPKTIPAALVLPAESVLADHRAKRPLLLIDVRDRSRIDIAAIPGAVHIPLHLVRTKAFLKTRPFILFNDGYGAHALAGECLRLKAAGFSPSILEGGLNLWLRKGGPLEGDPFAMPTLDAIAPREFFREKDLENTLVLDISAERSAESARLAPYAVHLPLSGPAEKVVSDLKKAAAAHAKTPRPTVLVFDQTGRGCERVRKILANEEMNLFFLAGGLMAYKQFLTDRTTALKPRENRLKSAGGCTTCAKQGSGTK